ncbi:hypothetical protein [Streptomyces parvulus]|uniref:hypothetical protein n=1 Tax=Streptomyces parvulus TaxID=146923 RepID=UPI0026C8F124|nr:hypothetical protein [Streptomyces parvulus]
MTSPTLDAQALERLISAAVAAPSLHDTHPWRFGLEPKTCTLEFRAAAARALPRAAPTARAVHLAVGCAVFNLRVAAVHLGWEPVTLLLPRPDRPDLLAAVRLADATRRTVAPGSYDAVWHRHSSRFPFSGVALPMSLRGELADAARTEGADLLFTGHRETERVLSATREGERRNRMHLAHAADGRRSPRGPTGRRAPGTGGRRPPSVLTTVRTSCRPAPWRDHHSSRFSPRPTIAGRTGCAPARHWNAYSCWQPRPACGPPCCTRPWSGPTCAAGSVARPIRAASGRRW